jgi:hypothetical protein
VVGPWGLSTAWVRGVRRAGLVRCAADARQTLKSPTAEQNMKGWLMPAASELVLSDLRGADSDECGHGSS